MESNFQYTWYIRYIVKNQNRESSSDGGPYSRMEFARESMDRNLKVIADMGHTILSYGTRKHNAPKGQKVIR